MKSFKQYLLESQQTYSFKVKIAGECPDNCVDIIKTGLTPYEPVNCIKKIKTPIQETHVDFPDHKNVDVTIFEVTVRYPVTSAQVRSVVATSLKMSESCVRVRTPLEDQELELNHQYDEKSGKSLLNAPYENNSNQDLVGADRTMNLLKELGKTQTTLSQYVGVNDAILAKNTPKMPSDTAKLSLNLKSPLGSGQNKLPTIGAK